MEVSVVISTYNRCDSLKNILDSLLQQEGIEDIEHEIIVVDNNSDDETKNVVDLYMSKFHNRLRYAFEKRQGLSFAKNKGINEARGKFIMFADDDVLVDKLWIANTVKCFRETQCDAVGGRVLPKYPKKIPRWIRENQEFLNGPIVYRDYGDGIKDFQSNNLLPFVGANFAFKSDCFQEMGLFKTDIGPGTKFPFGEDTEYFYRLKDKKKLVYCGAMKVWHVHNPKRLTLWYVAGWFFNYGKVCSKKEQKQILNKKTVCYFKVPRYLLKECFIQILKFGCHIFDGKNRLRYFCKIYWSMGHCLSYRELKLLKNQGSKKMKIAVITHVFPKLSEKFIIDQLLGLIDLGIDFKLLAFNKARDDLQQHSEVEGYQLFGHTQYIAIPKERLSRLLRALSILIQNIFFHPLTILKCLNFRKYGRYESINNLFKVEPFQNPPYPLKSFWALI